MAMGDSTVRLSRILTDDISILINVPIMKDHEITGVTGALKNHYGSVKMPSNTMATTATLTLPT